MPRMIKGSKMSDEQKQKLREKALAQKQDPEYIAKFNAGYHSKMQQLYSNPEWVAAKSLKGKEIAEAKKKEDPSYYTEWGRKSAEKNWSNPEYRAKMEDTAKALWDTEEKRNKQTAAIIATRNTSE